MCTALTLETKDHYFGRTLDIDASFGEQVCIMPRLYPISFSQMGLSESHYAMIGMSAVIDNVPLFYDAVNEHGLSMAGLNFPNNAYYSPIQCAKDNVASFEFIPWVLSQCKTIDEVKVLLSKINITGTPFNEQVRPAPLHWIICDKISCIVVEPMKSGLRIHENPVGVLTNNPPFEQHLANLNNYRNLRVDNGEDAFGGKIKLDAYSQGLGAVGLPGDVSSMSRFVRAAFGRVNSVCDEDEMSSVNQFFHILSSVEMIRGLCLTEHGTWDITVYSSCMNTDKGLYYYTTYDDRQIKCVDMNSIPLDDNKIKLFKI